MRSILFVNAKGGCGKTTLATNLASYYAARGVPTVLADFDDQASSVEWLQSRPDWGEPIQGVAGWKGHVHYPAGTERVIMDAPARIHGRQLTELVKHADIIIIPVLPSPIDIRAAAHFVGEMLMQSGLRKKKLAVVANRVRENTVVYQRLEQFLKSLKVPFVTHFRDTQNYIRAAARGIGIFEMAPSATEPDVEQWRPLIRWIERK